MVMVVAADGDDDDVMLLVQVLLSDGTVWAWGSNYYGQLGLGIESQVFDILITPNLFINESSTVS
jgi:hypothetical protein